MGTKNIIGELQVNGSPVVTEDTVEEKVGLAGYVKNTDIASFGKLGLMRVKGAHGMSITEDGYVYPSRVGRSVIDARANYRWLDCGVVDDIVVSAIKNCKSYTDENMALTDTEKASAQAWLGIDALIGDIEAALDDLHAYAQNLISGGE